MGIKHPELANNPNEAFTIRIHQQHTKPLTRLVQEALMIKRHRGTVLNRKEEYCRNILPSLQLENDNNQKVTEKKNTPEEDREEEKEEETAMENRMVRKKRKTHTKKDKKNREEEMENEDENENGKGSRKKK